MKRLSVYFTLVCTLSPILRVYSLTGNAITLLDILIVLFYIISLPCYVKKKNLVVVSYGIMLLYMLVHSIVGVVISSDMDLFMRAMHQVNYILFLVLYYNTFFDINVADKSIRIAGVAATLFLVLQHAAHFILGISIPGQIAALAVREANMENFVYGSNVARFSSFFAEPSAYGVFVVLPLAIELFYREKVNYPIVALLCLGCILSTSNTALACMGFLLFVYIIKNKLLSWKNLILIFAVISIVLLSGPFVEAIRTRVEGGTSFENRFIGYQLMSFYFKNPLFGIGFISMEDIGEYMPGFVRLVIYLGIIGVFIYSAVYLYLFKVSNRKIILILFLFLNIGSNILFAASIVYYSCFFLNVKSKKYINGKSINSKYILQRSRWSKKNN